ncbi:MAG: amidohydrolase [Lentibacter algarum]|uniref:amidohydrolase n=1 Tax=Lentibacter algarum TaxID=576131 RepID=UPI003BAF7606
MVRTTPDEVLTGGTVLTMDSKTPFATAIALAGGRILAVGTDAEIKALAGAGTKHTQLHGRHIMPGLIESHTHALWGACRDLFDVYTGYSASLTELLQATGKRAANLPAGSTVHGGPWRHEMRSEMGQCPRILLDEISREHPIVLFDTSQHVAWANTFAIKQAGLGGIPDDIKGGVIERSEDGSASGIFAESAIEGLKALTVHTEAQMAEAAREFTRYFNGLGFTAFKEPMAFEPELRAYHAADQRGEMTLHAAAHIVKAGVSAERVSYDELERLRKSYRSENLRTDFAKLFVDGVAPSFTASFSEPYLASAGYDVAGHMPDATLLISPEEHAEMMIELDRRGFTVKMHAVGDNAISKGLDAIAAARRTNGMSGLRHEIAHASFIADADVARFRALDAIAELSPKLWAPNAATPSQIKVLGAQRLEKIYRLKDLHAAQSEMTYASDWPASAPDANPWTGLAGMLTRRDVTGQFAGTVAPSQAISLAEALPLFTTNGARSLKMETETGSLTAGKWADFITLPKPLSEMTPEEIGACTPLQTRWKGRVVYEG